MRLRVRVATWLRALADWLVPPVASPVTPEVLAAATDAIGIAATQFTHSSSFKRLIALKHLRRVLPGVKDKVLNLAIELALQQ